MADEKERKGEAADDQLIIVTALPIEQPAGALAEQLAPQAAKVKSAAALLLTFAIFRLGSLQGVFGVMAAASVLCCAAPGALGTVRAARSARCASVATMMCCLTTFVFIGCLYTHALPELPARMREKCMEELSEVSTPFGADGHGLAPPDVAVLFGGDGHGLAPTSTFGAGGHGLAPQAALGADGHGLAPQAALGANGHGLAPGSHPAGWNGDVPAAHTLGANGHGLAPQATLGANGHGLAPKTALGANGHGLAPQAALGAHGHGLAPQATLGANGHGLAPKTALGADGHGLAPKTALGANGHGLAPGVHPDGWNGEVLAPRPNKGGRMRRLQEKAEHHAASHMVYYMQEEGIEISPEVTCAHVEELTAKMAPMLLGMWALFELCLFYAAMLLASRSLRLYKSACSLGM